MIRHYNDPTIVNGSATISYDDYSHDGYNCSEDSFTELTDRPSENPAPDVGLSSEIFDSLSSADQLWVGHSNRSCGPWVMPDPTAIFITFDNSETLSGPLGFKLPSQQLYMIFTNAFYTCVYRQVPPTPNPSPTPMNSFVPSHTAAVSGQTTIPTESLSAIATVTPSTSTEESDVFSASESPIAIASLFFTPSMLVLPTLTPLTTPEVTPTASSPTPPLANQTRSQCFPGLSMVELEGGASKRMDSLMVGDRVLVSAKSPHAKAYSPVFAFTHRDSRGLYEFVRICAKQNCILITSQHYIYIRLDCNESLERAIVARSVRRGHCVQVSNGRWVPVDHISNELARGLYNPQTFHGDIVVDNVRASTYTAIVDLKSAHAALSPLRGVYSLLVMLKRLSKKKNIELLFQR